MDATAEGFAEEKSCQAGRLHLHLHLRLNQNWALLQEQQHISITGKTAGQRRAAQVDEGRRINMKNLPHRKTAKNKAALLL